MSRPAKKKGVTLEQRRKWLRRVEELGDTIDSIATEEDYEPRTVSKHLDLARAEREAKEARLVVLRDSLKDHFEDIVKIARAIQIEVSRGNSTTHLSGDRMYQALRQHLVNSVLWKLLVGWEKTHELLAEAKEDLASKVGTDLRSSPEFQESFVGGTPDYAGMLRFFLEQAEFWKVGGKGLTVEENFHLQEGEDGMSVVKIGAYSMGRIPVGQAKPVRKALADYRERFDSLPEFGAVKKLGQQLSRQAPAIDEELAVIIMRRVVSGRCKYCPVQ